MGFTPRESDHTECGGVYIFANPITLNAEEFIFNSEYWGEKSNQNRFLCKKKSKSNREEKNTIVTSLATFAVWETQSDLE